MLSQPAFGRLTRALRLERGLSQLALARGGMSAGYLSRLESGARPPTEAAARHLAARLDVPLSMFDAPAARSLAEALAKVASSPAGEEAVAILTEALESDGDRDLPLRWQALWLLARAHADAGRHLQERGVLAELEGLNDRLRVPELTVRVRTELAVCLRVLGENAEALRHASTALALAADLSVADQVAALHALVSAEAEAGMLANALEHVERLCVLVRADGGVRMTKALWASSIVKLRLGDHRGAIVALEQALDELDGHQDVVLWMRLRLAAAALFMQVVPVRLIEARLMLAEAQWVVGLVGTSRHEQELRALLAHLAFAEGRFDVARDLHAELLAEGLRLSFRDRVRLAAMAGRLSMLDGDFEAGLADVRAAAEQASVAHHLDLAGAIWRDLAETLTHLRQVS